jgi:hypothetical protein
MGTTTTYALTYADSTSNVNLWTHFQNLATDVDTTLLTRFGVVAYWPRTTSVSSLAGAETSISRIDNIAFLGGVFYTIETTTLSTSVVAGETGKLAIRLSTAGVATTASAALDIVEFNANSGTAPQQGAQCVAYYAPAGNATGSVLLTVGRTGGTGTVTVNGNSTQPIVLMVKAWGKAPTASGVSL